MSCELRVIQYLKGGAGTVRYRSAYYEVLYIIGRGRNRDDSRGWREIAAATCDCGIVMAPFGNKYKALLESSYFLKDDTPLLFMCECECVTV